jgi:hypothetical protein
MRRLPAPAEPIEEEYKFSKKILFRWATMFYLLLASCEELMKQSDGILQRTHFHKLFSGNWSLLKLGLLQFSSECTASNLIEWRSPGPYSMFEVRSDGILHHQYLQLFRWKYGLCSTNTTLQWSSSTASNRSSADCQTPTTPTPCKLREIIQTKWRYSAPNLRKYQLFGGDQRPLGCNWAHLLQQVFFRTVEIRDITYSGISASMKGWCQQIAGHLRRMQKISRSFCTNPWARSSYAGSKMLPKRKKLVANAYMSPQTDSYNEHMKNWELVLQLLPRLTNR